MYAEGHRDANDTILSLALVLRVPLEEIAAIKSAIQERGGTIVYQRVAAVRLYITDEPPEHLRDDRNGNGH